VSMPVLLREVLQARREPAFASLLNLWAVEGDVLIGVDMQMSRVYRLTCPDALFFNAAEVEQHATAVGRLLDGLPAGCTAQLIVRARWDGGRLLDAPAAERPSGEMLRLVAD